MTDRPATRIDVDAVLTRQRKRRSIAAIRDLLHAVLVALIAVAVVFVDQMERGQVIWLAAAFFAWALVYGVLVVGDRLR